MTEDRIELVSMLGEAEQSALLTLNNAHARETSFLTSEQWRQLVDRSYVATCVQPGAALLVAFDQDAAYDSPNFLWFRERVPRFVYIDRIIVADSHRGKGLAQQMYRDLFRRMQASGQDVVTCEVNIVPPNPISDKFHAGMGFAEAGQAALPDSAKRVRYLRKRLN